ncbi:MAG: FAD-dependent monooxygenase [Sphingobacteriales bacterium]|nr:MAG: FAD-dependent monooxygenase [Sphingobacteriales bacterium]
MLLPTQQVAIVGGGPGGLTLANLLQQAGLMVRVYERDIDRNARVQGSPLDLHEESGLAALRKAGLMDAFKTHFMPDADHTVIMNPDAEVVFSNSEDKRPGFGDAGFRPEIDRGALRNILLDALHPETVVWNRHLRSMTPQGAGWQLQFEEQDAVYADFVVGADGARSKIRPYLTDSQAFYSGITMIEGLIEDAAEKIPFLYTVLRGGKIMGFGDGINILMGQKEAGAVGFYFSFKADKQWVSTSGLSLNNRNQLLQWFKSRYTGWNPVWQELLEQTALPLIPRPIYCIPPDQTWPAQANLTLMGDAAHVMPPFAGEGVNMAMRDALELAAALTSGTDSSPATAIAAYETSMRSRSAEKALESLQNGERMHSETALDTMTAFFKGTVAIQ